MRKFVCTLAVMPVHMNAKQLTLFPAYLLQSLNIRCTSETLQKLYKYFIISLNSFFDFFLIIHTQNLIIFYLC